jgi:hypothetical protein
MSVQKTQKLGLKKFKSSYSKSSRLITKEQNCAEILSAPSDHLKLWPLPLADASGALFRSWT